MRHLAAAVLALVLPGVILPGGLDLRVCFCVGAAGGCCHAGVSSDPSSSAAGTRSCCRAKKSREVSASRTAPRCSGCLALSVPAKDPARPAHAPDLPLAPDRTGSVIVLPRTQAGCERAVAPAPWHAPPPGRSQPLLI